MPSEQRPLFYKSPQVLRFEDHKDLVLDSKQDFSFAASANAIPITPSEFLAAGRCYPIVFVRAGDSFSAVAVTGLKQNENLFVDEKGQWRANTYIPTYVRRYPFILIQSEDRSQTVLGYDSDSARIHPSAKNKGGQALFAEDGTAGEGTREVMELCNIYHQQSLQGEEFAKSLKEHNLLEDRQVDMTFPDKSRYRLDGLLTVNAERFRELPAEVVADWHKRALLDAIVLHLASTQNWQLLLELQEKASSPKAA